MVEIAGLGCLKREFEFFLTPFYFDGSRLLVGYINNKTDTADRIAIFITLGVRSQLNPYPTPIAMFYSAFCCQAPFQIPVGGGVFF